MAGARLSGAKRRHQPERPGRPVRDRANHAGPHRRQAPDTAVDRAASGSLRPAGLAPSSDTRRSSEADAVAQAGRAHPGEALAGVAEADIERLLKTLQALKSNLTNACGVPVAGQKRASHG